MNRLNLMSASAIAVCAAAFAVSACAQEARTYDIPAGDLGDALTRFATQSDQQIFFSGDLVAGVQTGGLRGRHVPADALRRLLAGSGLTWSETRPGVIWLRRADGAAQEAGQAADQAADPAGQIVDEVEEVVVTGTLLRASGDIASPVVKLDRDALDRRGFGTVAEVLTALPQNYAGSATPVVQTLNSDLGASNNVYATGVNLRGLGPASTLTLVNGRRMAGTGSRAEFADISALPSAAVQRVDVLLDGASALYTAFAALDPLTQDKVSKLTGSVTEVRISRSGPALLGAGRSTVSRAETERPLLEPGEIRALPDDRQLVFVAGQRPLLAHKLLYDRREPFRTRANVAAPSQAQGVDAPSPGPHPWAGRHGLGEDAGAGLPLFKEAVAAMDDKKAAARAAEIFGRVTQEMAAQEAALDHLRGLADAKD